MELNCNRTDLPLSHPLPYTEEEVTELAIDSKSVPHERVGDDVCVRE